LLKKIASVLLTVSIIAPSVASANNEKITIQYVKEDYTFQKHEPVDGTLLGAYVLQDVAIDANMEKFNEVTGKKHASFFKYVGYGQPFPAEWVEEVKAAGAIPHIAYEPNNGLDVVQDNEYLRKFARDAAKAEVPIFLRYASEMNGDWSAYHGNPKKFIDKWKLVHDVFEEEAPNVSMVWTVFTFPEWFIKPYYPGDEYVDWVGVNIYNVVYHNNNIYDYAADEDPLELLDYVYNLYSHKKPIQISEFGATHYTVTDDKEYPEFAAEKITRLYTHLPDYYPRVKSIFYFDVNNLLNAPAGRKINDYSVTNDVYVLNAYKESIADVRYLDTYEENPVGTGKETFTFTGNIVMKNGRSLADVFFFEENLGLHVKTDGSAYVISDGISEITVSAERIRNVNTFGAVRNFTALPIREVAEAFGYKVGFDAAKNMITLSK